MRNKFKKKLRQENINSNSLLVTKLILKGTIIALCVSLISILVFAFLLKFTNISDNIIQPVNQLIKGISIFLGVFLGLRRSKELGLICGVMIGFIYTLLSFLIFSLLSLKFLFDITVLTDMIFGAIIGGICGIISVNIKKV